LDLHHLYRFMGIKGLAKLLSAEAPDSIKEHEIKNYHGRIIAVDASMFLYQFLVAVRQDGPQGSLTNSSGEVTSHLIGMFYRTIRMRENGIKPVYVFDGKPPKMKSGELQKRKEAREDAQKKMEEAKKEDNQAVVVQMERRLTKVTPEHVAQTKRLLKLMGVPVITATCEAEATCAEMNKKGLVYGVATEDMDTLCFGAPKLLRGLHYPPSRKQPVREFTFKTVLEDLGLSYPEFVDLCILCKCDYTSSIRGIGPKSALKGIRQHKNIEAFIKTLSDKYTVPETFNYVGARDMFHNPDVTDVSGLSLKWEKPDEEGLIQFLCNESEFSIDRVKKGIERLHAAKKKGSQKRLDSFFKVVAKKKSAKKPTKNLKKGNLKKGMKRKSTSKSTQKSKKQKS